MPPEVPETCGYPKCPMDTPTYVDRMMEMKNLIERYARDREEEKQSRHAAYAATSEVVDKLRIEVMNIDEASEETRRDVRTLQEIARDTNSLLQGVMGRPGMVAQVGEQQGQLTALTELVRQNTNAVASIAASVAKHEAQFKELEGEKKTIQRTVWMVMGGLAVLQILVQVFAPKLLGVGE